MTQQNGRLMASECIFQSVSKVRAAVNRAWQYLPAKARFLLTLTSIICLALGLHAWLASSPAQLIIEGRHNLHHPSTSILIDGNAVYSTSDLGNAKKRFGVFGASSVSFSKQIALESGAHVVEMRVSSPADNYDQTVRRSVAIARGSDSRLKVSALQGSALTLNYLNGVPGPQESGYSKYLFSLLATVGGTALSASVGFVVQEFLRSKRPGGSALGTSSANQNS